MYDTKSGQFWEITLNIASMQTWRRAFSLRPFNYYIRSSCMLRVAGSDVTINTNDSLYIDSTASFSAVTCVVFRANTCPDGAVALSTSTSSYTKDVYVLYLEGPTRPPFNSKIYAT